MIQESPNLEVIATEPASSARGSEKRKLPRLNLTNEQFKLQLNGKIFTVADLSVDGMSLRILDRADLILFPVGMRIGGELKLSSGKLQVKAQVRNLGKERIGLQFDGLDPSVKAELARFLDPKEMGKGLRAIPAIELGTIWYQGPSGTHLLLSRARDGQYFRLALLVLGTFIRWDLESGVSTGRVASAFEASEVRGVVRFETMLFEADPSPDLGKLEVAKTLLLSSNLPKDLASWCIRQLANPQAGPKAGA